MINAESKQTRNYPSPYLTPNGNNHKQAPNRRVCDRIPGSEPAHKQKDPHYRHKKARQRIAVLPLLRSDRMPRNHTTNPTSGAV